MYNKIVIGIDQSYTRTGISIAADGKLLKVSYIGFGVNECHSVKRGKVTNVLSHIIQMNKHKALKFIVVVERIRQFSGGNLSMDYIKSTGALIGAIVDVAAQFDVPVFSADTRAWKAAVVGTVKPQANKHYVDPKKWPTLKYVLSRDDTNESDLLIKVGKRSRKFAKLISGEKYCFNDDAADAACIALYGFVKGRNLVRED